MKKNNKIILLIACIFLLLLLIFTNDKANNKKTYALTAGTYLPIDNPLGAGVENIFLGFFGNDLGDESYKNVITRIDDDGNYTSDQFMDTILFLPYMSYITQSGAKVHQCNESDLAQYLVDEIAQMTKVNNTISEINNTRHLNLKINVFMTVILANDNQTESAINSLIDNSITAFNNANLSNLNLTGFYWYHEYISSYPNESNTTSFTNLVRSKGYKSLWIPFVKAYDRTQNTKPSYMHGYEYGFDFVAIQTSYYFKDNDETWMNRTNNIGRLEFTNDAAAEIKAGIEVEIDGDVYASLNCERYKEWLKSGISYGWNRSINTYYAPGLFSDNYMNKGGIAKAMYNATYKYAKGTLTMQDINNINCTRSYYSDFENVSSNKTYTTTAFIKEDGEDVWESGHKYAEDGQKLTDGIFGKSYYSDQNEWVGFSKKMIGDDYYITIDLGKNIESLSYYMIELNNLNASGIGLPNGNVKVYVSDDNENFRLLGEMRPAEDDYFFYIKVYELRYDDNVSGRYVKFEFDRGPSSFVFVSEVVVGKAPPFENVFLFKTNSSYKLNNNKNLIYGISIGTHVNTLLNEITTNGMLKIYDKNDNLLAEDANLKTGDKIKATFVSKNLEHTISVKGDVLGTGEITVNGIKTISKHIIDQNLITDNEYLQAADYNCDNLIKMNDVVMLLKEMNE